MVSVEYILLLIVVACAIGLIYISKKRKELEKEIPDPSTTSISTPKKEDDAPNPSKGNNAPNLSQKTIYGFCPKGGKKLCSFCDGENNIGAKVCAICGRDI